MSTKWMLSLLVLSSFILAPLQAADEKKPEAKPEEKKEEKKDDKKEEKKKEEKAERLWPRGPERQNTI